MRRDTKQRKNASQMFKRIQGTDWVVERMYQGLSQGKRAFDSMMLEMGRMVAEAIMYIENNPRSTLPKSSSENTPGFLSST